MKKTIASVLLMAITICASAQLKLSDKDFNNLVALGNLHSYNNMSRGKNFIDSANVLRTPVLNRVITTLIQIGKADDKLLEKEFLSRPGNDELKLWYVLREIHYNRIDTTGNRRLAADVAKDVLARTIDERWLLDNYYYFFHGGVAMLFNEADLSTFNFDLDKLGFKNDAEKTVFFLNMMDGLASGRYLVLQYLKKYDKILAFDRKMPRFNGELYYKYTALTTADFEWVGYLKKESYNERHIGALLNTLFIQYAAYLNTGDKSKASDIYYNSIMYMPEFFKYSKNGDLFLQLYDKNKK